MFDTKRKRYSQKTIDIQNIRLYNQYHREHINAYHNMDVLYELRAMFRKHRIKQTIQDVLAGVALFATFYILFMFAYIFTCVEKVR